MTLMATEKPAKIRLKARHPVTGRKPFYRDWWFEHEGVIFHISNASLRHTLWTIEPDTDHVTGSAALLDFIGSDAYWCGVAFTLNGARDMLAELIAGDRFAALRDAYTKLPVKTEHRQVAWDESSPVRFHRDRRGAEK
jgi:hypothetical protein